MAVTLMQAAVDQMVPKMQGALIQLFDQISPIFRLMPMSKIDGRSYDYEQVATMPSVAWRAVNAAYTESTGITTPFREYLKILGGECKVDRFIMRTAPRGAGESSMAKQVRLKVLAASNEFDRTFFEGSELSDPDEMVGLRPRLSGNQLILMGAGGAALTLAVLDQLIDAVPFRQRSGAIKRGEGIKKVLFMNRTLRRKITALTDAATGARRIEIGRDEWGQQVSMYGECEIHIIEESGSTATNLGFDEDPGDAVSDTASIYCVAFGDEAVHGIYNNGGDSGKPLLIDVQEFGELEAAPVHMVRFEGAYGMVIEHPRSAARLYGILNA